MWMFDRVLLTICIYLFQYVVVLSFCFMFYLVLCVFALLFVLLFLSCVYTFKSLVQSVQMYTIQTFYSNCDLFLADLTSAQTTSVFVPVLVVIGLVITIVVVLMFIILIQMQIVVCHCVRKLR